MPNIICHLPNGNFLEWSTVVDAPTTYGVPRPEFDEYCRKRYGNRYFETEHETRMDLAVEHGTSSRVPRPTSLAELVEHNRAGPNEECLRLEEILARFGQLPADYRGDEGGEELDPDGFQVIDSTTHETIGHAENEILTWKVARQIKARFPKADEVIIVAVVRDEVAAELEGGLKPYLVDRLPG